MCLQRFISSVLTLACVCEAAMFAEPVTPSQAGFTQIFPHAVFHLWLTLAVFLSLRWHVFVMFVKFAELLLRFFPTWFFVCG